MERHARDRAMHAHGEGGRDLVRAFRRAPDAGQGQEVSPATPAAREATR